MVKLSSGEAAAMKKAPRLSLDLIDSIKDGADRKWRFLELGILIMIRSMN
jgi:hypothetical protein